MSPFEIFGAFFKELRQRKGVTLRSFCLANGLDPGNVSKLERGFSAPPKSPDVLERYADLLGLTKGEDNWNKFFDLAAACSGQIPPDIMNDASLVAKLPLVFRTLRGQKVPEEQLDELAELIRRS